MFASIPILNRQSNPNTTFFGHMSQHIYIYIQLNLIFPIKKRPAELLRQNPSSKHHIPRCFPPMFPWPPGNFPLPLLSSRTRCIPRSRRGRPSSPWDLGRWRHHRWITGKMVIFQRNFRGFNHWTWEFWWGISGDLTTGHGDFSWGISWGFNHWNHWKMMMFDGNFHGIWPYLTTESWDFMGWNHRFHGKSRRWDACPSNLTSKSTSNRMCHGISWYTNSIKWRFPQVGGSPSYHPWNWEFPWNSPSSYWVPSMIMETAIYIIIISPLLSTLY